MSEGKGASTNPSDLWMEAHAGEEERPLAPGVDDGPKANSGDPGSAGADSADAAPAGATEAHSPEESATDASTSATAATDASAPEDAATSGDAGEGIRTPATQETPVGHMPAVRQDTEATPPDRPDDKPMGILGHLGELRRRLVRCLIAVAVAFMGCYSVSEMLFQRLCDPLVAAMPAGSKLIFTALPEAFFVYLQVGLVAALFVASPYIFYQIWAFIAPGLYEEEKRFLIPLALSSAVLFILGAAFCYFVVFPFAFNFFIGFASENIAAMPSLSAYLGFALKLLVAFGLICEMPLFTLFLSRMGLVTAQAMRRVRRYAVLVTFIVAAILTPPDVISQLLMAVPMLALYEVSILIAVIFGRKPAPKHDNADSQGAAA